jgi:hypothetical protein
MSADIDTLMAAMKVHETPSPVNRERIAEMGKEILYPRKELSAYKKKFGTLSHDSDESLGVNAISSVKTALGLPDDPITLHTQIEICPRGSLTTAHAKKLKISEQLLISCSSPATVQSLSKTNIELDPCHDLSSMFVRGWNTLPDELKIRVLSSYMDSEISDSDTIEIQYDPWTNSQIIENERHLRLVQLSKLTPEMATLSAQVRCS